MVIQTEATLLCRDNNMHESGGEKNTLIEKQFYLTEVWQEGA